MKIQISVIPHKLQRYDTLGDWWFSADGHLFIAVSEMPDRRQSMLIAIHELVEALLCDQRGIPERTVSDFDMAHLDCDDPGFLADAPYRREHTFADAIERLMAGEIGVDWLEYEQACEAVSETWNAVEASRRQA